MVCMDICQYTVWLLSEETIVKRRRPLGGYIYIYIYIYTYIGWVDGWMDGWMDSWMDLGNQIWRPPPPNLIAAFILGWHSIYG